MSKTIIDSHSEEEVRAFAAESSSLKEFQVKLGYSPNGNVKKVIENYCALHNISLDHFTYKTQEKIQRSEENVFIKNSTASQRTLRQWYLKGEYTEYKCSICGLPPEWQGKPLSLTLDHIDGNNTNNELSNLRWVCPNCDRQLDTYGSKNNHKERINAKQKFYCQICGKEISHGSTYCSDCYGLANRKVQNRPNAEELLNIMKQNNGNFTAVGRLFGVSDNAIRKWCENYGMSRSSKDYQ